MKAHGIAGNNILHIGERWILNRLLTFILKIFTKFIVTWNIFIFVIIFIVINVNFPSHLNSCFKMGCIFVSFRNIYVVALKCKKLVNIFSWRKQNETPCQDISPYSHQVGVNSLPPPDAMCVPVFAYILY